MLSLLFVCMFYFFKQKTAYELRISDWSSDVCSSDLLRPHLLALPGAYPGPALRTDDPGGARRHRHAPGSGDDRHRPALARGPGTARLPWRLQGDLHRGLRGTEIGRAHV